jgi:hypothetical protein
VPPGTAPPKGALATGADPAGGPRLELKGNLIWYNGARLRFGDRLETWTAALGRATRQSPGGCAWSWDQLGLDVRGRCSPDGRTYVSGVTVHFGKLHQPSHGVFPGVFVLQNVTFSGAPALTVVQKSLAVDTPLVGRGRGICPESAAMTELSGPDGFGVRVYAVLDMPDDPRLPSGKSCDGQVIDALEIDGSWSD